MVKEKSSRINYMIFEVKNINKFITILILDDTKEIIARIPLNQLKKYKEIPLTFLEKSLWESTYNWIVEQHPELLI